MLSLVVRRAREQWRMLAAVVLVVSVSTAVLGACLLLLDVTGERGFLQQVQRAQPHEVDVTAYAVDVPASRLDAVEQAARGVVTQVLAPMHPTTLATATSRMRRFSDADRIGYLATSSSLSGLATLTSGRWPVARADGELEAVAPEATARRLHLALGQRVPLGSETGLGGAAAPVTVVLVGTIAPSSGSVWASDPLSGAGFDPSYSDGSITAPAYGPFVVVPRAFVTTGSNAAGVRVDARPRLSLADDAALRRAVGALDSASTLLSTRVGDSARITRVASELPTTLGRWHAQRSTTSAAVLAILLIIAMLTAAALLLLGRLVGDVRASERELLVAQGLAPRQLVSTAVLEAALLAAVSAVLAVPAASCLHAAITHLPDLSAAGLAQAPGLTPGLVLVVLATSAVLSLVLVLSPLLVPGGDHLPSRRRALARSSADAVLVLVALAAGWQLRSRPSSASGGDLVLAAAPLLALVALTLLAVRLLPPVLALAASAAARSRSLLPLSLHPAAIRLSAATPMLLLSAAAAAATFGVAQVATWHRSQVDQADLQAGTDLSLAFAASPSSDQLAAVEAAVRSGVASPVTRRPLALGRYVGGTGGAPELVALDARHASVLLRGRVDGDRTWGQIGRGLVPRGAVAGVGVRSPAEVDLVGRAPAGVGITVTPTVVVQDRLGVRRAVEAAPVPLDGQPHRLQWSSPPGDEVRVVAAELAISGDGIDPDRPAPPAAVSVELRMPDPAPEDDEWHVRPLGRDGPVRGQSISVRSSTSGTVLSIGARLDLTYLAYASGALLATDFDPPRAVPVAVSRQLVAAVGAEVGTRLSATIDDTVVPLRVAAVVPSVPSAPGRIAVLADQDTLSRALIGAGRLETDVDGFWFPRSDARTTRALAEVGVVTTRSGTTTALARGPMQVSVPVAFEILVVGAALLLLTGAVVVVASDRQRQAADVSRWRAMGVDRSGARRLLFAEHSSLLVPLVLAGTCVGGAIAVALGPSMVRSDRGTSPVPPVLLVWPWWTELALAALLLLGCLLVAALAAVVQVAASGRPMRRGGERP